MSKSIYERVLNLRNRISLDGDDTIYEEDYLLLDEVLDYIESNEQLNLIEAEQKSQEESYNDTVDVYRYLEAGVIIKKQEKLLVLHKRERSMLEKYINGNYQPMGEHANILKQIDELESELNDNK